MFFHTDSEVKELVSRFESRTLHKIEWNHTAHLAVGLYYCFSFPLGVAKNLMRDGIYWLNDRHGTPNTENSGYHETLTLFWLERINDLLNSAGRERGLVALANEAIEHLADRDLPLKYFSRERLFSIEARIGRVEPDLSQVAPLSDLGRSAIIGR